QFAPIPFEAIRRTSPGPLASNVELPFSSSKSTRLEIGGGNDHLRFRLSPPPASPTPLQIPSIRPVESPWRGMPGMPIRSSMLRYRLLIGWGLSLRYRPGDRLPPPRPAKMKGRLLWLWRLPSPL